MLNNCSGQNSTRFTQQRAFVHTCDDSARAFVAVLMRALKTELGCSVPEKRWKTMQTGGKSDRGDLISNQKLILHMWEDSQESGHYEHRKQRHRHKKHHSHEKEDRIEVYARRSKAGPPTKPKPSHDILGGARPKHRRDSVQSKLDWKRLKFNRSLIVLFYDLKKWLKSNQ